MYTINASISETVERIIYARNYIPKPTKEIFKDVGTINKEEFANLFLTCHTFELDEEGVYFIVDKSAEEIEKDKQQNTSYLISQINTLNKVYHTTEEFKNQLNTYLPYKGLSDVLEDIKSRGKR